MYARNVAKAAAAEPARFHETDMQRTASWPGATLQRVATGTQAAMAQSTGSDGGAFAKQEIGSVGFRIHSNVVKQTDRVVATAEGMAVVERAVAATALAATA